MTMYARLPPEPQREEPQVEVFPDSAESDSKRGLSNYLDEFLSAIKVFGYLERPVFHELTRTMQTRRLVAGETILLEEEKGFCLVVDGLVQIFVKSNRNDSDSDEDDMGEGSPGDRHRQGRVHRHAVAAAGGQQRVQLLAGHLPQQQPGALLRRPDELLGPQRVRACPQRRHVLAEHAHHGFRLA